MCPLKIAGINKVIIRGPSYKRIKKVLIVFFISLFSLLLLLFIFSSAIAKYLIEKYDEEYTGRQITLSRAYVNPISGYIKLSNVKIYEQNNLQTAQTSDSIFFSAKSVSANFTLRKLFRKTYEISELTLNQPRGIIIQNKSVFNFNDLIEKFSPEEDSLQPNTPLHFSILKIKINNGVFYYRELVTPINYFIKNVTIESTGIRWDSDTIAATYSFLSGMGNGGMKGNFKINTNNLDFYLAVKAEKFDLNILEQYLRDLTNFGTYSANIDADLKVSGNFNTSENVTFKGLFAMNDFHIGKNPKDDYASFDKLTLQIFELSPMNHKYLFDTVSLTHPYVKYELYDYLDNMNRMFGTSDSGTSSNGSSSGDFNLIVAIGQYIADLSKNFFNSDYKVNRLAVYKGHLKFNDYSINEKFSMDFNPINIIADSIDKDNKVVNVNLSTGIKPYGSSWITLSVTPKDTGDFNMHYYIRNVPVSMFNPYLITYTSFPLDRGTIEIKGNWILKNGILQSVNHLIIVDPRITKKIRNKETKWIPMPLIMAFIRERGNVIDYEIPIRGNLKDPKFHLKDVILDVLKNIFVKPVTIPYRMEVKHTETKMEKSLTVKWEMRLGTLNSKQEKFIENMADFLKDNPEALIMVYPRLYALKEKEYILFFEAKKMYYLKTHSQNALSFREADSLTVDKMSIKDSLFVLYLNQHIKDSMVFTVQEKCSRLISPSVVNDKLNALNKQRLNAFMFYFREKGVEKQIKISSSTNVIPYNGFSFYKIEYKGDYPESLTDAYLKMIELNDEAPRKKYLKERKKNKTPW
jgi:hypothetical protein